MNNTNLDKANATSFELVFPKIPTEKGIRASEELTLNIFETIIPSVSIDANEQNWQGSKIQLDGGKTTFEPWTVNFVVDSDFRNWKMIYRWFMFIANNKDKFGEIRNKYTVDARLTILDNYRNNILSMKFVSAWPTMLTEVNLTYREAEPNLEALINIAYDYYELIE
jgi:hypothetical protein